MSLVSFQLKQINRKSFDDKLKNQVGATTFMPTTSSQITKWLGTGISWNSVVIFLPKMLLMGVLWVANENMSDSVDSFICYLQYVLFTGMEYSEQY